MASSINIMSAIRSVLGDPSSGVPGLTTSNIWITNDPQIMVDISHSMINVVIMGGGADVVGFPGGLVMKQFLFNIIPVYRSASEMSGSEWLRLTELIDTYAENIRTLLNNNFLPGLVGLHEPMQWVSQGSFEKVDAYTVMMRTTWKCMHNDLLT